MFNHFENKLETLKQRLLKTFSDVSYPKGAIAPHKCDECYELRETFKNKDWKTIDATIIEENYDQLTLFSGEAFHYFIIAYLIYSLNNFGDNLVCEFTIYSLTPSKNAFGEELDYWKEHFQNFSEEQMEIIYDFLNLVKTDEKGDFRYYGGVNIKRLKRLKKIIDSDLQ